LWNGLRIQKNENARKLLTRRRNKWNFTALAFYNVNEANDKFMDELIQKVVMASGISDSEAKSMVKNKWKNLKTKKPDPEIKEAQKNKEYRKSLAERLTNILDEIDAKVLSDGDRDKARQFFKHWNLYMPDYISTEVEGKKAKEEHLPL